MKKLPIENEILKQITIFGNGKDGDRDLTITYTPTEELKISSFELNDIDNEESWKDTIESFHNKEKEISGYCWQEIKIDLI